MENNSHSNHEGIYDIIIAGAGCAGLSLLYSILNTPVLNNQKILLIDRSFDKSNDRTWCFWEQEVGIFESLVCKQWEQISVHKNEFSTILPTAPFTYKMIEGLHFYKHVLDFAKQFSNVYWQEASITSMETAGLPQKDARQTNAIVYWEGGFAKGHKVFSSILPLDDLYAISQGKHSAPFLWQHFKGHLVEFEDTVFDQNVARLMDFNVDQKGATGFMYVLPLTDQKALVEYTLFSKSLLKPEDYVLEINNYIQWHYPNKEYKIIHEEIGAIPMTTQSFAKSSTPIYVIGTLGNAVKSSTGYAFHFIQQQVKQIVKSLINGKKVDTEIHNTRHQFYDAVLLHILSNNLMERSWAVATLLGSHVCSASFSFPLTS
jgi:lycopene beta-cyclase